MATLSYNYPSGLNTFIPTTDATASGGLVVEFSRNPDSFSLNKYTQLQQVEVEAGKYWRFDNNAMARISTAEGAQYIWADGASRPKPNMWTGFEMPGYVTQRLDFGFVLGDLAKYHAQKAGGVDLTAVNSRTVAGGAMVQRTRKAIARMMDTTIMPYFNIRSGANGAGLSALPSQAGVSGQGLYIGQYWDQGYVGAGSTLGAPYFRNGVNAILASIVQLSNGQVRPSDINIIMSPATAIQIAASNEILDFVKQSMLAYPSLQQDDQFQLYGLPSRLFGAARIIVEDAAWLSAHPFGTTTATAATRSWVLPTGAVIFASRPGGIDGAMMSYATCMGFFLEEMTVEVWDDPHDRLTMGHVVDNYDYQITAPITGFVVLDAVSGTYTG